MITIHFQPSFHKESLVTFNNDQVSYEILPRLHDVSELESKEKLKVAEYLKLKEFRALNLEAEKERFKEKKQLQNDQLSAKRELEKLLLESIEKPEVDDRMILDGIIVKCALQKPNSEIQEIEFICPETGTKAFKIMEKVFSILNVNFQEGPILNMVESTQSYFGIGEQWKITNENPLTIRIVGRLSVYEEKPLHDFFESLLPNQIVVLDIRNLDGMGAILFECFQQLIQNMKAVFWWIHDPENAYLQQHFDKMGIPKTRIFKEKEAMLKKIHELKAM
jgi:hypothetical protein